ncbi:MAG: bifunctional salicylyl-CoA 5-hydroxylase/oxidoreductase [Streptosporangiaceae bacterium]
MRVACVGGGPSGLFLAILLVSRDPSCQVTLFERNVPDDTFGFGVVFSQETLENIEAAEPETLRRITAEFREWDTIEMRWGETTMRSGGHQFAGLRRVRLLQILVDRAKQLGVDLRFGEDIPSLAALGDAYDVVVAADGVNSTLRRELADHFRPSSEVRQSKYVWLATRYPFDVFTFIFVETEWGLFQAHIYPYDDTHATFIVETSPETWRRAGLDTYDAATPKRPGVNDEASIRFCEELFADHLEGHPLIGNNSRWLNFLTVRNGSWHHDNIVLLGDAAHTAHFSVGSGTKLAMEDAIALADALADHGTDLTKAFEEYENERRPPVASLQRAAQASLEWFEGVRRYSYLEPERFFFQLLTRSLRVTYDNLRMRDGALVRGLDHWLARRARDQGFDIADDTPPMFFPFRLRGMELANRIVVSPMDQYSAVDGVPGDWHLVHLGSRAVGGAGLVFTEMTCVSPEGRISPGCTGLWNDEQAAAWRRIVDFAHTWTGAKIGLQLGHSGRKGSTKLMWEGDTDPLEKGNWPIMSASPVPYKPYSQVPREMTRADMDEVGEQFVRSARYGAECGFDILELHFAHGYLLNSFLTPIANRRTDAYGGSFAARVRYPLEVFDAVRAVWPDDRPMSVRVSATDWVEGGFGGDDAVALAALLKEHGCDIVDVSTGQVSDEQRPAYGRLYQTPFADRIRHEVGMPTVTVGAVSSVDDANTIIMSGRADLCAIARPHLVDPYWTLNAAMDLGYDRQRWPDQYLSGKTARRREQHPR